MSSGTQWVLTGAGALIGVGVMVAMGARGIGTSAGAVALAEAESAAVAQPENDMGQRLAEGLRGIEGCLGVDLAQWESGKNTICAWFENKAAVERWYYSETHKGFMGALGARAGDAGPMRHVDTDGPIMVMATISFDGPPALPASRIPFSQISIELFSPLPGGAFVKERLAPEKFRVEHMRDMTPEE